MKKRNTLLVLLTIFFQIPVFSSELIYIDSIDNNTIYVSNSSLFIRNNIIYYFNIYNNFYSINNGKRERLFENELNTLNKECWHLL
jgi:hypothetical protein